METEYDDKSLMTKTELYAIMHILRNILDWKEIQMSLEIEQDEDTGRLVDVLVFEDEDEEIVVELPNPMGAMIFRDFMTYLEVLYKNDDDDDTY